MGQRTSRRRVLVVEDESFVREALGLMLAECGCEVVTAVNGVQALAQVRDQTPDLVITDIFMPEKDGLETILELKRLNPEVKIMAISGGSPSFAPQDSLRAARSLGADQVMAKPFSLADLAESLDLLLARA